MLALGESIGIQLCGPSMPSILTILQARLLVDRPEPQATTVTRPDVYRLCYVVGTKPCGERRGVPYQKR